MADDWSQELADKKLEAMALQLLDNDLAVSIEVARRAIVESRRAERRDKTATETGDDPSAGEGCLLARDPT